MSRWRNSNNVDLRTTAERTTASSVYWRERLGREWEGRCRRCDRTKSLAVIPEAVEAQLCVYCYLTPPPHVVVPDWVISAPHERRAAAAAAVTRRKKQVDDDATAAAASAMAVESDHDDDDNNGGGYDDNVDFDDDIAAMDGAVFDDDECEVVDEEADREQEMRDDGDIAD